MSVMRLTMIVHSVDGDTAGDQMCVMRSVELPDWVEADDSIAYDLVQRLTTHIDDELKAMAEQEDEDVRNLSDIIRQGEKKA